MSNEIQASIITPNNYRISVTPWRVEEVLEGDEPTSWFRRGRAAWVCEVEVIPVVHAVSTEPLREMIVRYQEYCPDVPGIMDEQLQAQYDDALRSCRDNEQATPGRRGRALEGIMRAAVLTPDEKDAIPGYGRLGPGIPDDDSVIDAPAVERAFGGVFRGERFKEGGGLEPKEFKP